MSLGPRSDGLLPKVHADHNDQDLTAGLVLEYWGRKPSSSNPVQLEPSRQQIHVCKLHKTFCTLCAFSPTPQNSETNTFPESLYLSWQCSHLQQFHGNLVSFIP